MLHVLFPVEASTATSWQPNIGFPSRKKLTVPPLGVGIMRAVSVMLAPCATGLPEAESTIVVADGGKVVVEVVVGDVVVVVLTVVVVVVPEANVGAVGARAQPVVAIVNPETRPALSNQLLRCLSCISLTS